MDMSIYHFSASIQDKYGRRKADSFGSRATENPISTLEEYDAVAAGIEASMRAAFPEDEEGNLKFVLHSLSKLT